MSRVDKEMWTPFIKLWEEAADAGMTIHEMAALVGVNVNTLYSRQFALRQRGIMLPLLKGQRGPRGRATKAKRPEVKKSEPRGAATNRIARLFESDVIYVM